MADDDFLRLPGVEISFAPTDEALLGFYLHKKAAGLGMPLGVDAAIPTLDLFGSDAHPPWLLHPAAAAAPCRSSSSSSLTGIVQVFAPRDVTDWFYCFARTTPRGSGSRRTTTSGTWLTSGGDNRVYDRRSAACLGYKSTLAFKIPAGGGSRWVATNWVMHEFKIHGGRERKQVAAKRNHGLAGNNTLDEAAAEWVLCRIRCTKPMRGNPKEEGLQQSDYTEGRRKRRRTSRADTSTPEPAPVVTLGSGGGGDGCVNVDDDSAVSSCCLQQEEDSPVSPGTSREQPAATRMVAMSEGDICTSGDVYADVGGIDWASWAMESAAVMGLDMGAGLAPVDIAGLLDECASFSRQWGLDLSGAAAAAAPATFATGASVDWPVSCGLLQEEDSMDAFPAPVPAAASSTVADEGIPWDDDMAGLLDGFASFAGRGVLDL